MAVHEPVLVSETLAFLLPERGGVFVDCTVGAGGHSKALLEAGATRVIGFDRDPVALEIAREVLAPWQSQVELVHADYRQLDEVLDARGLRSVDGLLADLGVSSLQLDSPARGFSFRRDEPLDMRFDQSSGPTAAELLRDVPEAELADVIYQFGEERFSRRVARAIVRARAEQPLTRTGQLAELVRRAVPRTRHTRIDPATRTFQAVRIWVNRELEGLREFLMRAVARLSIGARGVIISFHSLEDRVVKLAFREMAAGPGALLRILTKRPLVASEAEIERNPRARSAKLRAAERVA
jgi:16S rRNA (cytosine1402-N4)-methyltransferase